MEPVIKPGDVRVKGCQDLCWREATTCAQGQQGNHTINHLFNIAWRIPSITYQHYCISLDLDETELYVSFIDITAPLSFFSLSSKKIFIKQEEKKSGSNVNRKINTVLYHHDLAIDYFD